SNIIMYESVIIQFIIFFFSSIRRHTRSKRDWSSDVCSSDLSQVSEEVREHFKDQVYDTVILRNIRLGEAPSYGQPITVYDPKSQGAENYSKLAKEVIARDK